MTNTYHFGVPAIGVWISHILIGAFMIYFSYGVMTGMKFPPYVPIIMIVIGSMAILYHAHLWYYEQTEETAEEKP